MQNREIKQEKILKLLSSPNAKYDNEQALILCQMNHFDAGMLFLYERVKLFKQILNYHLANKDENKIMETCNKYGDEDPNLWIDALWFFSTTDASDKLVHVLNRMFC